ncbi:MAG TPA: NAD(P)/FAD-dependent oxidoreductase [Jatrophihabitantaceae bacterium]|nr:NAD(P)/FAD-dependent oxidoreductase [Jatrophihabitantaceae bacterium]
MAERAPIAVIGAGLSGALLATLLARRGLEVSVYERRLDPRMAGAERGRSINLAVSARGLAALDQVGLADLALSRALPMRGRMVHPPDGATNLQPYSADGLRHINSIGRAELNEALLDAADRTDGVTIRFGHRLRDLDPPSGTMRFETADGEVSAVAPVVLACDGAYSAARAALASRDGFISSQDYPEHGYKELTIPAKDGDFAVDPGALHIWPRTSSMMIALPNLDRSFTCTLFWPNSEFAELDTAAKIIDRFERDYPDVAGLMPSLVDDFTENPVGSLVTVTCWPWVVGRIGLVGDAAHAILPFFGQGANCGFEDCIEIDRCLDESCGDWDAALDQYQRRRKDNTDVIAELSRQNFVEMRDRVNSPWFRFRSRIEHGLERHLGESYMSRYELVSFTTVPYSEIAPRLRRQRLRLLAGIGLAFVAVAGLARALLSGPRKRNRRHSNLP